MFHVIKVNGRAVTSFHTVKEALAYAWGLFNNPRFHAGDVITVDSIVMINSNTSSKETTFHRVVGDKSS